MRTPSQHSKDEARRARVGFVTLHGMGQQDESYSEPLIRRVVAALTPDELAAVTFNSVFYQRELQRNETKLWDWTVKRDRLNWQSLRKFVLFSLADAVGFETDKEEEESSYFRTQIKIALTLLQARDQMDGDGPLVIFAHSLGAQVFSSYLWDARRILYGTQATAGIWAGDVKKTLDESLKPRALTSAEINFLRGGNVVAFITVGCNIPVFLAAHNRMTIRPIEPPSDQFQWHNIYNPNDVLGWPLQPLGPDYERLVQDHAVPVGGWLRWWNPLSHTGYWTNDTVLSQVIAQLRRAFQTRPAADAEGIDTVAS